MWDYLPLLPVIVWCLYSAVNRRHTARFFRQTKPHWRRCYSRRSFLRLGGGVVVAGVLAFSGADEAVDRWHRETVRSPASDRLAHLVKMLGERWFFACWAFFAAVDVTVKSNALTRWGRRNFEAMLVGLPLLWTSQRALGSARPNADSHGPRWRPLADDKAASGHTFMAAIPWLNLAARSPQPPTRLLARLGSTVTGWSRLNDRMHYLSQIVLGYGIAWTAVDAVQDRSEPGGIILE
ncbi:MAG: phosphatase PAP2 family protein [bacterium]